MVGDVVIDSHENPSHMMIRLKRSKTDPFGAGFTLHFGRTGDELCPISAMLGYLARRPPDPGFLFLFRDGTPLSTRVSEVVQCVLWCAQSKVNGNFNDV